MYTLTTGILSNS